MVDEFKTDMGLSHDNDLLSLKALTEKLQLETRRKEDQTLREPKGKEEHVRFTQGKDCCTPLTGGREFGSIDEALVWLRKELVRRSLAFVVLLNVNGSERAYINVKAYNQWHSIG